MSSLQQQIEKKNSTQPYMATSNLVTMSPTDIDQWPYYRFFRGERDKFYPVVWGREAGFRQLYTATPSEKPFEPWTTNLCFQYPCSTVTPCDPNNPRFESTQKSCVYISP